MVCKNCGSYYPNTEKSCPYCGCEMTKKERMATVKPTKEQERELKCREKEYRTHEKERKEQDKRPVSATLITTRQKTETRKSVFGTIGRAAVGSMLAGPMGALIGAATTPGKTVATSEKAVFRVVYASGRVDVEEVAVGSARFKELSKLLVIRQVVDII